MDTWMFGDGMFKLIVQLDQKMEGILFLPFFIHVTPLIY